MSPKIIFIHMADATFERRDLDILRTKYEVKDVCLPSIRKLRPLLSMMYSIIHSDLVFCWYADHPTLLAVLLAKLFRRKSLVNIMGYEVARVPEIGYGRILKLEGKYFVCWAINLANKIIAVSNFAKLDTSKNLHIDPDKIEVVYHGFPYVRNFSNLDKKNMVITVAHVKHGNIKRKGLETFVKAGSYLPDIPFILVGDWLDESINYLKKIATPNISFIPVKSKGFQIINNYYRQAKVYVQASIYESFGCSLAEAMLWHCVPVVTRYGALPEVVGETGYYLDSVDNPKELAEQVKLALSSDKGKKASKRIREKFSLDNRKNKLLNIVDFVLNK